MAVVVYKCDTCKRELETPQDPTGLEVISRCIITSGCRGELYQTKVYQDYKRGSLPDSVVGLDDWQQRRVLYDHVQSIAQPSWIIPHNLGTVPSVSVYVDRPTQEDENNREEIIPIDTKIVSADVMILYFDRAWSGIAQLVARQSDPALLTPVPVEEAATVAAQQLSSTGVLTIATRLIEGVEPVNINIQLTYDTTTGTSKAYTYALNDQAANISPWSDANKVVIKGKTYEVRSFSAILGEMTTGEIGNGVTFRFTGVDPTFSGSSYRNIQKGEVLLLLATSPFANIDKITNSIIDVTEVTATQNQFSFVYDTGEFFALETVLSSVFPPIHTV